MPMINRKRFLATALKSWAPFGMCLTLVSLMLKSVVCFLISALASKVFCFLDGIGFGEL